MNYPTSEYIALYEAAFCGASGFPEAALMALDDFVYEHSDCICYKCERPGLWMDVPSFCLTGQTERICYCGRCHHSYNEVLKTLQPSSPTFDLASIPLPIVHSGFTFDLRGIANSRRLDIPQPKKKKLTPLRKIYSFIKGFFHAN